MTNQLTIPEWDLGDRLRKALAVSGISSNDMAEYLEVSRHTISNWLNGRTKPRTAELRDWARKTAVDEKWLIHGRQLPRLDSNQQPFGLWGEPSGPPSTTELRSAGKPIGELRQAIRRAAIGDTATISARRAAL